MTYEDFKMTVVQQRKILKRIVEIQNDLEELKRVRMEVGSSGYSSATLSSSGGSKSFTRMNLKDITELIHQLQKELHQLQGLLTTGVANPLKTIVTVYF